MSFNLIESVRSAFSGDETNQIAGVLGESASNVQQAIHGMIPAVLTGILMKAGHGDTQDTLNLATDACRAEISYNQEALSGGSGNQHGMDFLKSLFGEKTSLLSEAIANYSGANNQSVTALLTVAAPITLSVLGKHILDSNMNASGLRSFLNSQKKKILNALPSGIFLDGILGTDNITELSQKISGEENLKTENTKSFKWVWIALLALITIGAIFYFLNKSSDPEMKAVVKNDSVPVIRDTTRPTTVNTNPSLIKLPDGVVLNAKKGGIEDQLVTFFLDAGSHPSRRFPFTFDQLNFNNGTSVITNESMKQIQNVALILKAFPNVKIKIGGFNDRGVDDSQNKSLSESRATAVSDALKSAGVVPAQIVGVEGFGSDFAKYDADAADSLREKDRRISLSIRAK